MQAEQLFRFGSYQLDLQTAQLWRGTQAVKLPPKALAVLCLLVTRAGQVVTKEELFQAVWPDVVVGDDALTSCVQELRQALRDDARRPRFVETVHRRGFRFVAEVQSPMSNVQSLESTFYNPHSAINMVGRAPDLTFLHERLAKALSGERQIVFVTGEAGIGKTTLIGAFLRGSRNWELGSGSSPPLILDPKSQILKPVPWWLGWGQCIEHYGTGEAYLPILEALGRLCRESDGKRMLEVLNQHAPTWLMQMPGLLSASDLEALQRRTYGATRERMLRELAEAFEVITQERPLVLVLEDLHWSDVSTLDWLAYVARRREPCRLLVLGTYRPVEVMVHEHPLKVVKQELQLHGHCQELALDFLTELHVEEYLEVRFPVGATGRLPLRRWAHLIHQRTDGNPLFMVNVTNELITQGVETRHVASLQSLEDLGIGVPENLRQLIEQQLARVSSDERKILETASVAGAEFSAAAVAAGVERSTEVVETHCDNLVRREQFLRPQGTSEWPDGTVAARYAFVHALYQEVLYEQLSASRRVRLHRQIGEREEQGYGERVREIAAELAMHFERGREHRKAVQYLQYAGENAVQRSAYQEAITLLAKGLESLKTLPDTSERAQQELNLQVALGTSLSATKGFAAPEVGKTYARARELCQQVGETPQLFPVLRGLRLFYGVRAEHRTARELGEQLLRLAQRVQDPALLLEAHMALQSPLLWLGEVTAALRQAEQGIALYTCQQHHSQTLVYGQDPGVTCLSYAAFALWYLGYPTQALHRSHETLTRAQDLAHPFSMAYAVLSTAMFHHLRRDGSTVQKQAESLIVLSRDQGFAMFVAWGTMLRGWALAEQGKAEEGIAMIREGLAAAAPTTGVNWLLLLTEAYEIRRQAEEGLSVLAELLAMARKNGTMVHEAELYRLRGELTLQQANQNAKVKSQKSENREPKSQILNPDSQGEAETCFLKAVDIARSQQAKSLELRATMSLARLWQQQGKTKQAHKKLSKVYHWFTEGFDTKDLQEAKALLEELSH